MSVTKPVVRCPVCDSHGAMLHHDVRALLVYSCHKCLHEWQIDPAEEPAESARRRSLRIATAALPVLIGGTAGRLVNVSATGALVHAHHSLPPDCELPMHIDVGAEPVDMRVRVIRSYAISSPLPDAMWQQQEYAVAVAVTELEPRTEEALKTLCGDAFGQRE